MKRWKKCWIIVCAAAAALSLSLCAAAEDDAYDEQKISENIYIGEVYVGDMTFDEACAAVEEYTDSLSSETVVLKAGDRTLRVEAGELGIGWEDEDTVERAMKLGRGGNLIARYKALRDLEKENAVFALSLSADEDAVRECLDEHADEINQEAVDYGLIRENGEFQVTEGVSGIELNIEKSVDVIKENLQNGWSEGMEVALVTDVTEPRGSEEELAKVEDVLGTYTTDYSSSASGRKTNVKQGAALIDGSVVYPGETFSVYETVSPFDEENGYALAGSYENGTTVETYGGGICQVSTTLYNALIRAELEITERYGHSMIVAYVDPSADAAIAGTDKDLKFTNNLESPIYIAGYADGETLTFTVYGEETRPEGREVSFESETTSTTEPTVEFRATSSEKIGSIIRTQSSHTGKTARLWKIVTVNGVEESREVFNNTTYAMSPTVYSVGISSSSSEAVSAMQAAIATQNESTIRAAASKWANASAESSSKSGEEESLEKTEEKEDTDDDADTAENGAPENDDSGTESTDSGSGSTDSGSGSTDGDGGSANGDSGSSDSGSGSANGDSGSSDDGGKSAGDSGTDGSGSSGGTVEQ